LVQKKKRLHKAEMRAPYLVATSTSRSPKIGQSASPHKPVKIVVIVPGCTAFSIQERYDQTSSIQLPAEKMKRLPWDIYDEIGALL
jgi:hypothetical protein